MDNLRWILLGVAFVVIVAIFFLTRSRKNEAPTSPLDAANEMPSFSPDEKTENDWIDSVGPVKVVIDEFQENIPEIKNDLASAQSVNSETQIPAVELTTDESQPEPAPENINQQKSNQAVPAEEAAMTDLPEEAPVAASGDINKNNTDEKEPAEDDVIAVYVLASSDEPVMKGEKILSASYALHLQHGDMKIFHRSAEVSVNGVIKTEIQFSMANMLEPGWFDIEDINQLETRGLSFFMQAGLVENPAAVLDEMLICAHSMSTMLGAKLCNAQRQSLDEAYTRHLRNKVKRLIESAETP